MKSQSSSDPSQSPEADFLLDTYIRNHIEPEPEHLRLLDRRTNLRLINGRMCSGHLQGRLLKMLVKMIRPNVAVELGTFSGYSALCIAEGLPEDAILHTFEIDDELEDFIIQSFEASPYRKKIILHIGDAAEELRDWKDHSVDLFFIDADKRAYPEYYQLAKRLLKPGGYIIADNTLWDGHVIEPSEIQAAQTKAICCFNDMAKDDPDMETVIIPLRDGLTIIRKK